MVGRREYDLTIGNGALWRTLVENGTSLGVEQPSDTHSREGVPSSVRIDSSEEARPPTVTSPSAWSDAEVNADSVTTACRACNLTKYMRTDERKQTIPEISAALACWLPSVPPVGLL